MSVVRCAIYTRKSSEEGLEQSFNSLHAQREACEAYVLSQKGAGWKALPTLYDDGGCSGGTMERSGLQQLLDDIRARRVDVVVVYKVDRLTRALADFAKIVEVFDENQVSFVSVTQAFNTTSSMGRLTLNVLLSFAQFEREVTGERIRDKIAASKAKGMWMGGYPPLGYVVERRALVVVPDEAGMVRHIFERYLQLKSVRMLQEELDADGIRSKQHVSASGHERGGTRFSRGALFYLLRNRIYLGEIVHKKQSYPGQHDPVIAAELFERVQKLLATNAAGRSDRRFTSAPLAGLVFDTRGARMTPVHSYGKSGKRYRYYVSEKGGGAGSNNFPDHVCRVSAPVLEELVLERVRSALDEPTACWPQLKPTFKRIEVRASAVSIRLVPPVGQVIRDQYGEGFEIKVQPAGDVIIGVTACMQPRKGSTRVKTPASRITRAYYDRPLIAALKRAHRELADRGGHLDFRGPCDSRGVDDPYLRRIVRLAFLAPDIQLAILAGRQPPGLSLQRVTKSELPLSWASQRVQLGFD